MRGKRLSIGLRAALAIFTVTLFVTGTWAATTEKVLHSFNGTDGDAPSAALISDAAGNLYGTTFAGGTQGGGFGAVFELSPTNGGGWREKELYTFKNNGTDGLNPYARLIFDATGNLYGTTAYGGTYGSGTVFELSPTAGGVWTEKVLHSFGNGTDGVNPYAGLIFDAAGNLYGTTYQGGTYGSGSVFELIRGNAGRWTEKVLHSFGNGADGAGSYASLIIDAAGNLYGTTFEGGAYIYYGTVFELMPVPGGGWTEMVLHSFSGADGGYLEAGLIFGAGGNLYGTTEIGGANNAGTVFELTPTAGGGWTENVLYSFHNNGTDGFAPIAGLVLDAAGNLYGTTALGGTYDCAGFGCGTVFELMPEAGGSWTEEVLHSFNPADGDGGSPEASLIFDAAGNLYGTTFGGGANRDGTVFELLGAGVVGWTEEVLYSFLNNGMDGSNPYAGLIFDKNGNLYGTTYVGGTNGDGTAFELTPAVGGGWTEKVLHTFGNGTDGTNPWAGLIFDKNGNLYGTTHGGGTYYIGYGTVFELTPAAGGGWTEKVLHSFNPADGDGQTPEAGLIFDAVGNLYGTTVGGGTYGDGTVFELTPAVGGNWAEKVLYSFNPNRGDGVGPAAGLIFDAAGNLYGTTYWGGTYDCPGVPPGCGTVFELTPTAGGGWTEKVLHSFLNNGTDGTHPAFGTLIFDALGNLYGTTEEGGTHSSCYGGCGTVFELTPTAGGGWTEKVLHNFGNGADGAYPFASLIFDATGNLYSTTQGGGTYGDGTVFELTPAAGGDWTENVLHNFNITDGLEPYTGLIFDAAGNLYGTTYGGGNYGCDGTACGTVFELTPH